MYDTLINKLKEHYTNIGDKLALGFKSEKLTYSELYNKIQSVASKLYTMGIKKGDRVIFTALSKPEMAAVYLGIQYIGGIAVFADKNGTAQNIAAVYKQCDASLLLTDKPMKEYADGINIFSMSSVDMKEKYNISLEEIISEYYIDKQKGKGV